jgi:tripartite-type tricarboxylate transporter receptor subunit TctC
MMAAVFFFVAVGPAAAEYPERPVTVINPFPAGGLSDLTARAVVEGMKKNFPKGIAVVNRPGGGGSIGVSELVAAAPDGYTIALAPIATLIVQPQINTLPYKTPDDYDPIINVVSYYQQLAVNADAPWQTAQEFLTAARQAPDKIRLGSSGIGTSAHLNLEELVRLSKIKVAHVPFSGWAEGSVALLGKHIDALIVNPGEGRPQIDAKRMRVLAAFAPSRSPYYPDVPTFKELGYDASIGLWFLLVAPKGTPATVAKFIHDSGKAAMGEAGFAKFVKMREIEADYRGLEKLRADLWQEYRRHTDILTRLNLRKN